ncbi:hypothetical protein GYH30_006694 [Glycine max]|nr:hypothetical protein GYH30_006694 [Glycine max]
MLLLRHLHLGGNFFSGQILLECGTWQHLQYLAFSDNEPVGNIARELGNLSALFGKRNRERTGTVPSVAKRNALKGTFVLQHAQSSWNPELLKYSLTISLSLLPTSLSSLPTSSTCNYLRCSGSVSDSTVASAITNPPLTTAIVVPSMAPETFVAVVVESGWMANADERGSLDGL